MRRLIRADGTTMDFPDARKIGWLANLIHADTLDTVQLRHMGHPLHVMLVDDNGHAKGLPVNHQATTLYWLNCKPDTKHEIVGDVFIVPDEDFA